MRPLGAGIRWLIALVVTFAVYLTLWFLEVL